jgi:hypothetical protein
MAEEENIAGEGLAGEQDEKETIKIALEEHDKREQEKKLVREFVTKDEKDHDAEFDAEQMKEKVKILEISDEIKEGLADTRIMLEALKADIEGGWPIVERLLRMVPEEKRDRMIRDITTAVLEAHDNQRREQERHGEVWTHPFSVRVKTSYYQCAECGAKLGDEIVVVVQRLRGGDKIRVFCHTECLAIYASKYWELE